MSVYRRKGSKNWYIRIGREVDQSSGTTSRSEALALEAKWRREKWLAEKMGEEREETFDEAALEWARDIGSKRKGWDRDWYRLQKLVSALETVSGSECEQSVVRDAIPAEARSAASRNHYISLARSVLRYSHQRGRIHRLPTLRTEKVDNARVRYLRDWNEANDLIAGMPLHWQDPARFTLYTGVRLGTLRALRRDWLSKGVIRIPGAHTKSGRVLPLPLSPPALALTRQPHSGPFVFQRPDGQPLGKMESKTWKRVLERSGIQDFRWHDLRHTWASWMMMTGKVTLYELQQLGDWSTPAMVQRYAHLAPDYLRTVVDSASAHFPGSDEEQGVKTGIYAEGGK